MAIKPGDGVTVHVAKKLAGSALPRPDGLWDCLDASGRHLAVFPNRARAVDALVTIGQRPVKGVGTISLAVARPQPAQDAR